MRACVRVGESRGGTRLMMLSTYCRACCPSCEEDQPTLLVTGWINQNLSTLNNAWLLDVRSSRWMKGQLYKDGASGVANEDQKKIMIMELGWPPESVICIPSESISSLDTFSPRQEIAFVSWSSKLVMTSFSGSPSFNCLQDC